MTNRYKQILLVVAPVVIASFQCWAYRVYLLSVPYTVEAGLDIAVAQAIYWALLLIVLAPLTIGSVAVLFNTCHRRGRFASIACAFLLMVFMATFPAIMQNYRSLGMTSAKNNLDKECPARMEAFE